VRQWRQRGRCPAVRRGRASHPVRLTLPHMRSKKGGRGLSGIFPCSEFWCRTKQRSDPKPNVILSDRYRNYRNSESCELLRTVLLNYSYQILTVSKYELSRAKKQSPI
jgi:hypothetical protein